MSSAFFCPVGHCFIGWPKINLKVYDVVNCLNKNFRRKKLWHWNFVNWQSFKQRTFLWENHAENIHQKLVPGPFLILVNNPKQPLHARSSFKNKIFWNRIIKKPSKTLFFLSNQFPFNGQDNGTKKVQWNPFINDVLPGLV